MRLKELTNKNWEFYLEDKDSENRAFVDVPHTWNAFDGQDGGSDYHRGRGVYTKYVARPNVPEDYEVYLEFEGVNSVAEVFIEGDKLTEHRGGYSTFRVNITDYVKEGGATVQVIADNTHFDDVYPQSADFTFYGGIYRDVHVIAVPETHFELDFYGAPGVAVDAEVEGEDAVVNLRAWTTNVQPSDHIRFMVEDVFGEVVSEVTVPAKEATATQAMIEDAELWRGVKDPYLYTLTAELLRGNDAIDYVSTTFGIREYTVDPKEGFFLNGEVTKLRGVARHQDRLVKGNALSKVNQIEDAELISEIGANTVRLAHYQHSQFCYDLADAYGFAVWAEIPFISVFNEDEGARENTIEQMKELVYQNYNHPSIMFWGISNEISIGGESEALLENLQELNDLTKEIDPTRLTTMAQVTLLPVESPQNQLTDVLSYNHYYGWYFGNLEQNEEWLDKFHKQYPDRALGLSEYGAEGIVNWHSDEPKKGDYTEEYHAIYHEHMAKILNERDYIWSSHVWNMFDFGADNRDEGGIQGRNNKGLVSFDRRIKKDAFYIYKAYWSDEPFVHVTGRRFAHRPGETTDIKVYSNEDEVTLRVDGKDLGSQKVVDHIAVFKDVALKAAGSFVTVETESDRDMITLRRVENLDEAYIAPEAEAAVEGNVTNWFEDLQSDGDAPAFSFDEKFFSIKDTVSEIMANDEAEEILNEAVRKFGQDLSQPALLTMFTDKRLEELSAFFGKNTESDGYKYLNDKLQSIEK